MNESFSPRLAVLTVLLICLTVQAATAQDAASDPIWEPVHLSETEKVTLDVPGFQRFALDRERLGIFFDQVPAPDRVEAAPASVFPVPLPDGSTVDFYVEPAPVLAQALADDYPDIRTFRGHQVDDPAVTVRLVVSAEGFHARVFYPEYTVIVERAPEAEALDDAAFYTSARRSAYPSPPERRCIVKSAAAPTEEAALPTPAPIPSGTELRIYRLAVATTGEFTAENGGTVASTLLRIARTVNTLNEIYERDVGVRFVLVDGTDQLIFTDATTDPFDNFNATALTEQAQTVIDFAIGDAGYDVGHVFSTSGDSLAYLAVAGVSGEKAMGTTGWGSPGQDPFDIDYVAHEIGHQFGASHTFNGRAGDCKPGNHAWDTAFEPGSGSTIMGYAGICGIDNLQYGADAYFHAASLAQIAGHVRSGPGHHSPPIPTGNQPPVVEAGPAFDIPRETPFMLTAVGRDPDGGLLTYCWEELDLGVQSPLSAVDNGSSPLFRSFPPTSWSSRIFPRDAGDPERGPAFGERLPSRFRRMNFRVTVRDHHRGGGGTASADTHVRVIPTAGPFQLTAPAAGTFQSGFVHVTWDVARTDRAPILTDQVEIRLSVDGGWEYPVVLASSTSNDGSEILALPPEAVGETVRLRVGSTSNVFFAVSEADFVVGPAWATVFVVRHAEKVESGDQPLTREGHERARDLADLLAASAIGAVRSTRVRRTEDTARPTADHFGLPVVHYDDVHGLLDEVLALRGGEHVLVVGHSDTVPEILYGLGVDAKIEIGHDEFDNLFVATLTEEGTVFRRFRYGSSRRPRLVEETP